MVSYFHRALGLVFCLLLASEATALGQAPEVPALDISTAASFSPESSNTSSCSAPLASERAAGAEGLLEKRTPVHTEFILNTTTRWQFDNGDRTELGDRLFNPSGENFGDVVSTLGGKVTYGQLQGTVRLDAAGYLHRPVPAATASQLIKNELAGRYEQTVRLEYISLQYASRKSSFTLGDFYTTLGRGMLLAVRKVDNVGVDNKLRGGEGRIRFGKLAVHGFGGFLNIKNFEQGTGYVFEDPNDLIAGGRVEFRESRYVRLGTHVAYIRPKDSETMQSETLGYGASLELPRPVSWASLYVEGAVMLRDVNDQGNFSEFDGKGLYGNLNLFLGDTTILAEGKWYDNFFSIFPGGQVVPNPRQIINRITEPPTAERPLALVTKNRTVRGGRLRVDHRISPAFVPYLSGGLYRDTEDDPEIIWALFGGARARFLGAGFLFEVGHRDHREDDPGSLTDGAIVLNQSHLLIDWWQKLTGDYSFEFQTLTRRMAEAASLDTQTAWIEGRTSLSLKSKAGWSLFGAWEYYTKSPEVFDEHYLSGGGQWKFMKGGVLRALFGGERAGLKCSGGVCRFFPGFEGGRLELNLRI